MRELAPVRLDLNNPVFQRQLFALPRDRQTAALNALRKLAAMSWPQVYADAGLHWEVIVSRVGPRGGRLYSLRIGRGFRAVAYRDGEWLRLLTLHPDHDTAYR
jgi:hypothetical protein